MHEREDGFERHISPERRRVLGLFAAKHALADILMADALRRATAPEQWWREADARAIDFMETRAGQPKTLLVIAAQHPLVDGRFPGGEFSARLARGRDRAIELEAAGGQVEIYVPGSRHRNGAVSDELALADAGGIWLHTNGLPETVVVHGENLNTRYKGEDGVYNAGDEAFVSAAHFAADDAFGSFELVCSEGQTERWQMHAIASGAAPVVHEVAVAGGYHDNPIRRALTYYTYHCDPSWQSSASLMGALTRRLRRPK